MDDDFSDLEAELKQLRPRSISAELATRIDTALAHEAHVTRTAGVLPPRRKFRANWFVLGGGLAAAAAVVLLARVNTEDTPRNQQQAVVRSTVAPAAALAETPREFVPDGLTRVVYRTRNEGLVFPQTADQPVRRIHSRTRETLHWREPATGASLRVSYPIEEVEFIPISGQ